MKKVLLLTAVLIGNNCFASDPNVDSAAILGSKAKSSTLNHKEEGKITPSDGTILGALDEAVCSTTNFFESYLAYIKLLGSDAPKKE